MSSVGLLALLRTAVLANANTDSKTENLAKAKLAVGVEDILNTLASNVPKDHGDPTLQSTASRPRPNPNRKIGADGIIRMTGVLRDRATPACAHRRSGGGGGPNPGIEEQICRVSLQIIAKLAEQCEPVMRPFGEMLLDIFKLLKDRPLVLSCLDTFLNVANGTEEPTEKNEEMIIEAITALVNQEPVLQLVRTCFEKTLAAVGLTGDIARAIVKQEIEQRTISTKDKKCEPEPEKSRRSQPKKDNGGNGKRRRNDRSPSDPKERKTRRR